MIVIYRILQVNSTTVALSLLLVILGVSAQWGLAEGRRGFGGGESVWTTTFSPSARSRWSRRVGSALRVFLAMGVTASKLSASARGRAGEADARRVEIEHFTRCCRP